MNTHNVVESGRTPARTAQRSENKFDVKEKTVSPRQREGKIATAADYRAEHRGFAPGQALDDWIDVEAEIDGCLGAIE